MAFDKQQAQKENRTFQTEDKKYPNKSADKTTDVKTADKKPLSEATACDSKMSDKDKSGSCGS